MAKAPKRIHRRKRNKTKKKGILKIFKNPKFLGNILFLVLFFSSLYLFYFSSFFQVEQIEINAQNLQIDDLKNKLGEGLKFSINFFGKEISTESIFLPLKPIISELKTSFPEIENINFKRKIPNILTLEIKERDPLAFWCQSLEEKKDCSFVDKNSVFFQSNDFDGKDLIKIEGEKKDVKEIVKAIQLIKEKKDKSINEDKFVIFEDKLIMKISSGPQVFFDIKKNLDWQVEKLNILLKEKFSIDEIKNLKYIDLRFGNQAIIR